MPQVRDKLTEEETQVVRELMERAREMERRRREWKFPMGSPNTPSKLTRSEE